MFSINSFPGLTRDSEEFDRMLASADRFLVLERSAGLGDCLSAIAHGWLFCQKTGRALVINLAESRYLEDPERNAASEFFYFPSEIRGTKIIVPNQLTWNFRNVLFLPSIIQRLFRIYPPTLYFYNRARDFIECHFRFLLPLINRGRSHTEEEERAMVSSGCDPGHRFVKFSGCHSEHQDQIVQFLKEIKPNPKIEQRVNEFVKSIGRSFVGLHVRYYSPKLPPSSHTPYWIDFDDAINQISSLIDRARSETSIDIPIVLATDSRKVQETLLRTQKNIIVMEKEFGKEAEGTLELHDKKLRNHGFEAVTEMFVLTRGEALIRYPPSRSWFSELAWTRVPLRFELQAKESK